MASLVVLCQEHGVRVLVDTDTRTVRHTTEPLSVATSTPPVGGCVALRLAAKAIPGPDRIAGPHGPINPRTGRNRCYLTVLQPGQAVPLPPWSEQAPAGAGTGPGGPKPRPPYLPPVTRLKAGGRP